MLKTGSVGQLQNVTFDRDTKSIDAVWCYQGQRGVVRFYIVNDDTQMDGTWGFSFDRAMGTWQGNRLDVP